MIVKFLVSKDKNWEEEVFAYFPEEVYNESGDLRLCYSHIGQHGACHVDFAKSCRPAEPKEYIDLKTELEQIYKDEPLKII